LRVVLILLFDQKSYNFALFVLSNIEENILWLFSLPRALKA